MRGQGAIHIVSENIACLSLKLKHRKLIFAKEKLCWKCQKDKHTHGGLFKRLAPIGGLMKFICKDCIDAKQLKEANETKNITST